MLDNMSLDAMRKCVSVIRHRAIVEASGGVTLDNVGATAETVTVIRGAVPGAERSLLGLLRKGLSLFNYLKYNISALNGNASFSRLFHEFPDI
jgi:hypothetical protein